MPTPDPAPTAVELVTAAQIMAVTPEAARTAIEANSDQDIVNGQWTVALTYISQWNAVFMPGTRSTKKVGPIEWFEPNSVSELDFRNRLRTLYGLDPLLAIPGTNVSEIVASHTEHHDSCGCFNELNRRRIGPFGPYRDPWTVR